VLKPFKRAREDSGFTLITVMVAMMLLGLFVVTAWAAANQSTFLGRSDQDRQRAYEAAQAGVEWYAYQLAKDPTYWEKCASPGALATGRLPPITLEGDRSPTWSTVTDANGIAKTQEQWRIEILNTTNASGQSIACSTANPSGTALQDGTLRIRATGRANGKYRSIIGTFRRQGFVDYIYFTQWETQDPIISGVDNCNVTRSRRPSNCVTIQFQNADKIQGPMHTNDESVVTCGSPTFGRAGKGDKFEVAGPSPGYVSASGCGTSTPVFNGPKLTPASTLTLPDGNTKLATLATSAWTFTGQTCLNFRGNVVDVYTNQSWATSKAVTCNTSNGGRMQTLPLTGSNAPPNGVIYVQGNGGSCAYSKVENYDNSSTCGDVAVQGSYSSSITIGAANDIVVNGNITKSGDQMMGLVASNFVRVYHPQTGRTSGSCGSTPSGYSAVTEIDAAILALSHSFVVDNYDCGSALGNLQVNGAIAQYYRGTVGTGSGTSISTGYAKDYNYDDRLKYRSPPNFLDPVETRWDIVRQSEQKPAQQVAGTG
jgi:Tfp pilus assembly protein PilX